MRWVVALGMVAALLAVECGLALGSAYVTGHELPGLLAAVALHLAVVGWVLYDSARLGMHRYEGGMRGVTLFLVLLVGFVLYFPLYLVLRSRSLAGKLRRRRRFLFPGL
jgi:hypothetical protein